MYNCIAKVAETYVLVYLGIAVFGFPFLRSTTWLLCAVALLACCLGRMHIDILSGLYHLYLSCPAHKGYTPPDEPPPSPISAAHMLVVWLSGLRGSVTLALATVSYSTVSYSNQDFTAVYGGLADEAGEAKIPACSAVSGMTDSLAIVQTSLLIT